MAQKGFEYESNAYKALEKFGISTGGVAGASHDKPDLTVKKKTTKSGVELKNAPTAAGSLVMKYYDGSWDYGDTGGEAEKEFIKAIGKKVNLLKEMNISGQAGANWRGKVPHLQNDASGKKIFPTIKDKRKAYAEDIKLFGGQNEVKIEIPAKYICDYYITKKCSYINVGTHGFYTLNGRDDLGLQKSLSKLKQASIPDFARVAKAQIRVRCQYKGGGDYQFVLTMAFTSVAKSPYNIAPLKTGSKSEIDTKMLTESPLISAFRV